jgi:glutaminyl-tRNA synthetase
MALSETPARPAGQDFIRDIIRTDLDSGRYHRVVTRFPPEPNGYLHIGHAKSIVLNFGVAGEFGGHCSLRFDDTNPTREEQEYIDAIERDVRWMGFDWGENLRHASDYFEQLYDWAEHLIGAGKAYVDDQSPEEMRANRGTLTEPGRNSPFRDRSVEENIDLFRRMRAGEFPNGTRVLRAKIDMASGNINLRDPVLYRILHARIRAPARLGISIPAMTSPTASPTRSRVSRTRFARWSSPTTGLYMTGSSRTCRSPRGRVSMSSRGST